MIYKKRKEEASAPPVEDEEVELAHNEEHISRDDIDIEIVIGEG